MIIAPLASKMAYMLSNIMKNVVVDTSVFVSALIRADKAPRQVMRLCLLRKIQPFMGNALLNEFESLLGRKHIYANSPLTDPQRRDLFNDFLNVCQWVSIYYLWRPNLRDEADNHLIELALAGGASYLITSNIKDFKGSELLFPQLEITTASDFIAQSEIDPWQL